MTVITATMCNRELHASPLQPYKKKEGEGKLRPKFCDAVVVDPDLSGPQVPLQ